MSLRNVDVAWHTRAACRGPNQIIFFPPPQLERRSEKRSREARAKEICAGCAVQDDCRAYALSIREPHGIWGGMTENERRSALAPTN